MARRPLALCVPLTLGAATALTLAMLTPLAATAAPPTCAQSGPTAPMRVTVDCVDPLYAEPVIDSETDETTPVAHHRISGHFANTNIEFNIYLHAVKDKKKWDGRFFQFTYPTTFSPDQNTARASDRAIGFALASGGYAVQAGNGSLSLGYRHTAAAAKFAESVAADYYGSHRNIYGYLYGPSGGSFQTIGAAENTEGVWDGFVPLVQAVPQPTMYNFMGRSAAELILGSKAAQISDALLPGGSGKPFAKLDAAERAMLRELHALGVPWKAWEYPDYLLGHVEEYYGAGLDSSEPLAYDPTYVDDFWGTPGYLGTEQSALGARVREKLAEMGDTLANRWNIANRFYYRYQVPPAEEGWTGLDQFRANDGSTLYPQRPVRAPLFSGFVSGNTAFDGSVNAKVIAVANLYDTDALPWHTDWYRQRVEASLGAQAKTNYRIYFTDHADHQDAEVSGDRAKHLVNWYGSAEQALRDLARWVEDDVPAPRSTAYGVKDAQIVVPTNATQRRGIQPTVDLRANGREMIRVKAGKSVKLSASVQTPRDAGKIIRVEWDFDGGGEYSADIVRHPKKHVVTQAWHRFTDPGTYFVSVRVTSERNGDTHAKYALVQNIDRVRVVVTD